MSMKITRPITVKAIITDDFKEKMAFEMRTTLAQLEQDLQKIDLQQSAFLSQFKGDPQKLQTVRQKIEAEKEKRLEQKQKLLDRLKRVASLQLGQEIIRGKVEGEYEVLVDDCWEDIMSAEIILKDGKVVEIRGN